MSFHPFRTQEVVVAHSCILEFLQGCPGETLSTCLSQSHPPSSFTMAMKYVDIQDDGHMERVDIMWLETSSCEGHPFAELYAPYRHILASVKPKHLPTVLPVLQVILLQCKFKFLERASKSTRSPLVEFDHAMFCDFLREPIGAKFPSLIHILLSTS